MELLNIDATTAVLIIGFTMGVVEFVKALFDKNIRTATIIFGAAIAGLVAGVATGYTPLVGVVAGLAASGVITLTQNFGKNAGGDK